MTTRRVLTGDEWLRLAAEPSRVLRALWADTAQVYALFDGEVVSTAVEDGAYPALSPVRPLAAWFERMVRDLWGHVAEGGTDLRPWLDHGRWPHAAPMATRPGPSGGALEPPEFLHASEELDQLGLGPVHGLIAPSRHVRLGLLGETVVRAEARFGYTHKGTLALMRGKSPRAAARFAARVAGEATVAHSLAFARAAEAALEVEVPPRAETLRGVMLALERITTGLDARASLAEAQGRGVQATEYAMQGEAMRCAADTAFGHRLMMDCIVPGGLASDIAPGGAEAIARVLSDVPDGAGSLSGPLPDGPVSVPLPVESGEGLGHADGPNGEIWHWLSLDHGQIASLFMADPGWVRLAELEAALAAHPADGAELVEASMPISSSGIDL